MGKHAIKMHGMGTSHIILKSAQTWFSRDRLTPTTESLTVSSSVLSHFVCENNLHCIQGRRYQFFLSLGIEPMALLAPCSTDLKANVM